MKLLSSDLSWAIGLTLLAGLLFAQVSQAVDTDTTDGELIMSCISLHVQSFDNCLKANGARIGIFVSLVSLR